MDIKYFKDPEGRVRQVPADKVDLFKQHFHDAQELSEEAIHEMEMKTVQDVEKKEWDERQQAFKNAQNTQSFDMDERGQLISVAPVSPAQHNPIAEAVAEAQDRQIEDERVKDTPLDESIKVDAAEPRFDRREALQGQPTTITETAEVQQDDYMSDPDNRILAQFENFRKNKELYRDQDAETGSKRTIGDGLLYDAESKHGGRFKHNKKVREDINDFLQNTPEGRQYKQQQLALRDELSHAIDALSKTIQDAKDDAVMVEGYREMRDAIGGFHVQKVMERENSKDIAEASLILRELENARDALSDVGNFGATRQVWREFTRKGHEIATTLSTMGLGGHALQLQRLNTVAGVYGDAPLTQEAFNLLTDYEGLTALDRTIAQDIAKGTVDNMEFVANFTGSGAIVRAVTKGAGKEAIKQATKLTLKQKSKRMGKKIARTLTTAAGAKYAVTKGGAGLLKASGRTALQAALMPSAYVLAYEETILNPEVSFLDAFSDSYTDMLIEVVSENFGDLLPQLGFKNPYMRKFTELTGIHSFPAEFLEEQFETLLSIGKGTAEWADFLDWDEQAVTLGVLALSQLPGGAFASAGYAAGKAARTAELRTIRKAHKAQASLMNVAFGKEAQGVMNTIDGAIREAWTEVMETKEQEENTGELDPLEKRMRDISKEAGWDSDQEKFAREYARAAAPKVGADIAKEHQKQERREKIDEAVDAQTNQATGKIVYAKVPGVEAPVMLDGDIVFAENGEFDRQNSQNLFYTDPATGKKMPVGANFVGIVDIADAAELKAEMGNESDQQVDNDYNRMQAPIRQNGEQVRFEAPNEEGVMTMQEGIITGISEDGYSYEVKSMDGQLTQTIGSTAIFDDSNMKGVAKGADVLYTDDKGQVKQGTVTSMDTFGTHGAVEIDNISYPSSAIISRAVEDTSREANQKGISFDQAREQRVPGTYTVDEVKQSEYYKENKERTDNAIDFVSRNLDGEITVELKFDEQGGVTMQWNASESNMVYGQDQSQQQEQAETETEIKETEKETSETTETSVIEGENESQPPSEDSKVSEEDTETSETEVEKRNRERRERNKENWREREARGESREVEKIPEKETKYTRNLADKDKPFAPLIPLDAIQFNNEEDGGFTREGWEKAQLLEVRGRNLDGVLAAEVRLTDSEGNVMETAVLINESHVEITAEAEARQQKAQAQAEAEARAKAEAEKQAQQEAEKAEAEAEKKRLEAEKAEFIESLPKRQSGKNKGAIAYDRMSAEQTLQFFAYEYGEQEAAEGAKAEVAKLKKKLNGVESKLKNDRLNIGLRQQADALKADIKMYNDYADAYYLKQQQVNAEAMQTSSLKEQRQQQDQKERQEQMPGQAGEAVQERWNSSPKHEGFDDSYRTPTGQVIEGTWTLVEAEAVTPSHNPHNGFHQHEGFPQREDGTTVNDRDYSADKTAQGVVQQHAANYNEAAVQDPVVVSQDGVVLSGNGRTMAGQVAAQNGTDGAYVDYITRQARKFGLTTEQVQSMNNPRIVFVTKEALPYNTETFAMFNVEEKKSQSNLETAVKASKTIKAVVVRKIANIIGKFDNLSRLYASESATQDIVDILLAEGSIKLEHVPALKDGNKLSPAGRSFLETIMIGAVLGEQAIRETDAMPSVRQTVMRIMPQLMDNAALGEYGLSEEINNALHLLYEGIQFKEKQAKSKEAKGEPKSDYDNLRDYMRQTNMFGEGPLDVYTATERTLALMLLDGDVKARQTLDSYNERAKLAADGVVDMFEGKVLNPTELFNNLLQHYAKDAYTDQSTTEQGRGATESQTESSPPVNERVDREGQDSRQESGEQGQSEKTTTQEVKQKSEESSTTIEEALDKDPIRDITAEEQAEYKGVVEQLSEVFGIPVQVHTSIETVENRAAVAAIKKGDAEGKQNTKGWFDGETAHIYIPNATSRANVVATFMHEVLAHKGVKETIGAERHGKALEAFFDKLPRPVQEKLLEQYGNKQVGADEYLAWRAENGAFMGRQSKRSVLRRLIDGVKIAFATGHQKYILQEAAAIATANEILNEAAKQAIEDSGEKLKRRESVAEFVERKLKESEQQPIQRNEGESVEDLARRAQEKHEAQEAKKQAEEKKETKPPLEMVKPEPPSQKIEDVGEKIGGAKKDLYDQLKTASESDIESQPLSKLFPRPKYKELVDNGTLTASQAMFLAHLRETIPNKPRKPHSVKRWAESVKKKLELAQTMLESAGNADAIMELLAESLSPNKLSEITTYINTMKAAGFPGTNVNIGNIRLTEYKRGDFSVINGKKVTPEESKQPLFVISNGRNIQGLYDTREEAETALRKILQPGKKGSRRYTKMSLYQNTDTGEVYIGRKTATGIVKVLGGFKTGQEARDHLNANQDAIQEIWDSMRNVQGERRLTNRERVGKDWRNGANISAEEFGSTFGFRGVEFGNWVNQSERQMHVNEAYDALMDLADVLGIDPSALSLAGELGFAFGARGSGNASAHYEPGKVVINLTKTKGAGSLAHEWWHALDNYFSRMRGQPSDYLTQSPRTRTTRQGADTSIRAEMVDAFKGVMDAIKGTELEQRSRQLDRTRSQLYWSTPIEMSARALESYIISRLSEYGHQNDYLANFKDTENWIGDSMKSEPLANYPYPIETEQHTINEAFDQFFGTIEQKKSEDGRTVLFRDTGAMNVLETFEKQFEQETNRYNGELFSIDGDKVNVTLYEDRHDSENNTEATYIGIDADEAYRNIDNESAVWNSYGAIAAIEANHLTIPADLIEKHSPETIGEDYTIEDALVDGVMDSIIEAEDYDTLIEKYGVSSDTYDYAEYREYNKQTDQLIYDVQNELSKSFGGNVGKYTTLYVGEDGTIARRSEDIDGESQSMTLRIADHTHNPARGRNDVTVVIANKDQTASRFRGATTDLVFDDSHSASEISSEIESYIRDIYSDTKRQQGESIEDYARRMNNRHTRFRNIERQELLEKLNGELKQTEANLKKLKQQYGRAYRKYNQLNNKMKDDPNLGMAGQGLLFEAAPMGTPSLFGDTQDALSDARAVVREAKEKADELGRQVAEANRDVTIKKDEIVNATFGQQTLFRQQEVSNRLKAPMITAMDFFENAEMQQARWTYQEVKETQDGNTVVFVEYGDDIITFGRDAHIASKALNTEMRLSPEGDKAFVISKKEAIDNGRLYNVIDRAGRKVAVAEAIEESGEKGYDMLEAIVERRKNNPRVDNYERQEQLRRDLGLSESIYGHETFNMETVDPLNHFAENPDLMVDNVNWHTAYEIVPVANPLINVYNAGRSLYKLGETLTELQKLRAENLHVHKKGTLQLDLQKAKRLSDRFNSAIDGYARALISTKQISTETVQMEINDILRKIEYSIDYYERAAQGEDMTGEEFNPRFRDTDQQSHFYSTIESALPRIKQERGTKEQFKAMLLRNGAKQAELNWMDWDALPDRLTKDEIQEWVNENRIEVKEVMKGIEPINYQKNPEAKDFAYDLIREKVSRSGNQEMSDLIESQGNPLDKWYSNPSIENKRELEPILNDLGIDFDYINEQVEVEQDDNPTQYHDYAFEDGENYKELLLTIPTKVQKAKAVKAEGGWKIQYPDGTDSPFSYASKEWAEKAIREGVSQERSGNSPKTIDAFTSGHFDEKNVVAHVRFNERTFEAENKDYIDPNSQSYNFDDIFELIDIGESYQVKNKETGSVYASRYPKDVMKKHNMTTEGLKKHLMERPGLKAKHPEYRRLSEAGETTKQKVLFIEELQSDWAQEGRDKGFRDSKAMRKREAELSRLKKARDAAKQELADAEQNLKQEIESVKKEAKELGYDSDRWSGRDFNRLLFALHPTVEKIKYKNQLNEVRTAEEYNAIQSELDKIDNKQKELGQRVKDAQERKRDADLAYNKALREHRSYDHKVFMEGDRNKAPDMPFKTTDQWLNLSLRRMMKYAADNGFDYVAWTTGQHQTDRYNMAEQISELWYNPKTEELGWQPINSTTPRVTPRINKSSIADYVGKELADKLLSQEVDSENLQRLSGDNLEVGGEGMKTFYNNIVPSQANKIGRPFKSRVEVLDMGGDVGQVLGMPVTQQMKDKTREGVPLFRDVEQQSKAVKDGLVALHNISETNLLQTAKHGKLPMPSIAITKAHLGMEGFGEITLIANKDAIDPQADRRNKIYSADAYTVRYPSVTHEVKNEKAVIDFANKIHPEVDVNAAYMIEHSIKRDGLNGLRHNNYVMFQFATEKGLDVLVYDDAPYSDAVMEYVAGIKEYQFNDILNSDELRNKIVPELTELFLQGKEFGDTKKDESIRSWFHRTYLDENGHLKNDRFQEIFEGARKYLHKSENGKPINSSKTLDKARHTVNRRMGDGFIEGYERYVNDLYKSLNVEQKLFAGFTGRGKRYVENTPENALKIMLDEAGKGSEGFSGVGRMIALQSETMRSLDEIRDSSHAIIAKEEYEKFREELTNDFNALSDMIYDDYKIEGWGHNDAIVDEIASLARDGESVSFHAISEEAQALAKKVYDQAKNAPAQYFEAKPERMMHADEFSAAVVPHDISEDARKALKDMGVETYDYNSKEDRASVIAKASDEMDLRFRDIEQLQAIKSKALKDGTFMFAPNGEQTNLTEQEWLQTQTNAFKEWFGDSKIVDENGDPRIVYHQTKSEWSEYDSSIAGAGKYDYHMPNGIFTKTTQSDIGLGDAQIPLYMRAENPLHLKDRAEAEAHFAENAEGYKDIVKQIADNDIRHQANVDALIKKSREELGTLRESGKYIIPSEEWSQVVKEAGQKSKDAIKVWTAENNDLSIKAKKIIDDYLKNSSYDAVVVSQDEGSMGRVTDAYIALSPNQIKSSVDNTGEFSSQSNDIRFRILGEHGAAALDAYDQATRRMDNLGTARAMVESGKNAKAIKRATGWEKGADGKWRYEIPGEKLYYPGGGEGSVADLLGRDSKLMKAYPELKDVRVEFIWNPETSYRGAYNHDRKTITVNSQKVDDYLYYKEMQSNSERALKRHEAKDERMLANAKAMGFNPAELEINLKEKKKKAEEGLERLPAEIIEETKNTIWHEVQHAIQFIEGFEIGGNWATAARTVSDWAKAIDKEKERSKRRIDSQVKEQTGKTVLEWGREMRTNDEGVYERLVKGGHIRGGVVADVEVYKKLSDDSWNMNFKAEQSPGDLYNALAGEVEARNAAARMSMTPSELRSSLLEATEDVDREDQIMLVRGLSYIASVGGVRKASQASYNRAESILANNESVRESTGNYNDILQRVFNNSKQKAKILDTARNSGMDLRKAIENHIAGEATSAEVDALARTIGMEGVAEGAIRYMFWKEANPDNGSVRWKAENALKRREYQDDILFRDDGTPVRESALEDYESRVRAVRGLGGKENIRGLLFGFEEGWLDSMASLRILQDAIVGDNKALLDKDGYNAYRLENSLSSKNFEQGEHYRKKYLDPLNKEVAKLFGTLKEADRYLIAKHGLERNIEMAKREIEAKSEPIYSKLEQQLADEVITGAEFLEKVNAQMERDNKTLGKYIVSKDYSGLTALYADIYGNKAPDAGKYTETVYNKMLAYVDDIESEKDTKQLWELINNATKYMLERQYDSGMMSKEGYERIKNMYKHYVPLRGFDEVTAGELYDYFLTYDGNYKKMLRKAYGRTSLSESPMVSLMSMAQSGLAEVNRNDMKKAFYKLVAENPNNLATIQDVWYVKSEDGMWNERHPEIPANATGDAVSEIVSEFEESMTALEKEGKAKRGRNKLEVNARISKSEAAEHAVKVWIDGEEKMIYINGSPRAAQALSGLTSSSAREKPDYLRPFYFAMRQMAENFTSRNPEFIVTNAQRDINYAITSAAIKESTKYATQLALNATKVGPTIAANLWGKGKADGKYQKYWEEFTWNGGETGYTVLHSDDKNRKYINKELRKYSNKRDLLLPFRVWVEQAENTNRLIEANTRFAAYVTSREMGREVEQSIANAKDISVNFNRKGSGAYGAAVAHDLFLFSNPALQSMRQMGLMAKNQTGRFAAATAMTIAGGFMMPLMNRMLIEMFGDDDDKEVYDNLSEWTKYNHMVMYIPGSKDKFVSYALSHEMRGFHGLGVLAFEAANGEMRGRNGMQLVLEQFANNLPLDPMGGKNTFIPDAFRPAYEAYITNENFMGRPIYRDNPWNQNTPGWTKAYPKTPTAITNFSKWLNEFTGGDEIVAGWGDINPARLHHVFQGYMGGAWTSYSDMVSQVYGAITGEEEDRNIFNAPILRKAIRTSDATNRELRVNSEYYYWLDWLKEYNRASSGYKRLSKDKDRSVEEQYQYGDKYTDLRSNEEERAIHKRISRAKKKIDDALEKGDEQGALDMKAEVVDELWEMVDKTKHIDDLLEKLK